MKKFTTLVIAVFVFGFAIGQVEIEWQKTIGGSSPDRLESVLQTPDGGYILGGYSQSDISGDKTQNCLGADDFWIVKTDSLGNIQWQNTIGGTTSDYFSALDHITGGFILGGYSFSLSGWPLNDYHLTRINMVGTVQWDHVGGCNDNDLLKSVHPTSDGGFIVGGTSYSDNTFSCKDSCRGECDYWIWKTNSGGSISWDKTLGGDDIDDLANIFQTTDGGYIVGGSSSSYLSGDKTEVSWGDDYWILKLDALGNIQWQNTIGGWNDDILRDIKQTSDGGYILGGFSSSGIGNDKTEMGNGSFDFWIVKIDSFGNIQWQNTIGGNKLDELYSLQKTIDGGYILAGTSTSNVSGDKGENSIGFYDCWIVKIDSSGVVQWDKTIGSIWINDFHSIQQTLDEGYILGGSSASNISGDKNQNSKGSFDYWILKLTDKFNSITGDAFLDLNSNQVYDSGDYLLHGQLITESNTNRIAFSEQNGNYALSVLDTGNFFVFPAPINNYTAVPVSHNGNFTGIKQTDSLNDFAFQPIPGINDLQISITPLTAFRPGFDASYLVSYKNVGTTTLTASIVFYLDDTNYTYSSASVTPSLITSDSVLWNNITLNPWQQGSITVTVHVNASVPIGTYLGSFCIINPIAGDNFTRDNYASWNVQVTGSVDPNDKLVSDTLLTTTQLADSSYLDYIIRFQNTGTDTAFNARVLDNIPANLDLTTFQLVTSSHAFNMSYKAHSRLMTFTFDNILLPDSNTNELASHGFIRYRIRPLSTLAVGDTIKNTAFIYFDFNQPTQTNWAQTEIVLPNSIDGLEFNARGLKLYPNPVSDLLHIQYALNSNEKTSMKIFDVTGRIIYERKNFAPNIQSQINVSEFANGVYVIQLTQNGKTIRGRFIKN